jgi:hypothetical protein
MRARAPDVAACDRCHAPLAAALGRDDPLAAEGVTCEVCHAIADVAVAPAAATWTLQLAENRKYGPICDDVQPPYFHRAGCSPLHAQSRLCAACHHLAHPGADGELLPVFSEFEEWQHGEAMPAGLHCQGCHMPDERARVATGGELRDGVSNHAFASEDGVVVDAALRREPDALVVAAVLRAAAPHALPAGLPGRQLVLAADLVDGTGASLAAAESVFARVLVDADGAEAPFFAAARQAADTRLRAGEARSVELRLPAAATAAAVELRLLDRPLSPALARMLDVAAPPRVLTTRRLEARP